MKTFNTADIRSWNPCYDPARHLPEDWTGTALDMLQHTTIPTIDKLWLIRRYSVMTSKGLRLFAVACAERAQIYPKNYTPDPRTSAAIEVARRYAEGEATAEDLRIARSAAFAAEADAADAAAAAAAAAADNAAAAAAFAAYAAAAYAAAAADDDDAERQAQIDWLIEACSKPGMFVEEETK